VSNAISSAAKWLRSELKRPADVLSDVDSYFFSALLNQKSKNYSEALRDLQFINELQQKQPEKWPFNSEIFGPMRPTWQT
jgi:hypothetical protein